MKRLKLFILIFSLAVSVPLAFVIWQTYGGLEQEERSQMRFFSETLFDQMEKELAELIQREENRAVDEYRFFLTGQDIKAGAEPQLSSLAQLSYQHYILGYLQNNPDGSFQTPLVNDMGSVPVENREIVAMLKEANLLFNMKKMSIAHASPAPVVKNQSIEKKEKVKASFSERYLKQPKKVQSNAYLGKKQQRVEQITADQALNMVSETETLQKRRSKLSAKVQTERPMESAPSFALEEDAEQKQNEQRGGVAGSVVPDLADSLAFKPDLNLEQSPDSVGEERFQVEVAPFQSVSLKEDQVYLFRRIAINDQIYRQGFVVLVEPLLQYLIATHYINQPLARFTELQIERRDQGRGASSIQAGAAIATTNYMVERIFPPPFDFLSVTLRSNTIPASPARRSLNIALVFLGVFMLVGLLSIYQSARAIVSMSERRSQFVSSVTHELKTPLTNIRMYIEMLEQGIAATPEREQEYLKILGLESTRLSGLINNVLELAKLEKKQRHFHMVEGHIDDVLTELETVVAEKLQQEGFTLQVESLDVPVFAYDRDVLIQVLMNLIENSVKFGKQSDTRHISINVNSEDKFIRIAVSDTGPGIPRYALRKIFEDFYRVDNDLTRTTGGTGIGLSLVKKFITAMGGSVEASNNDGPGCTITLLLPFHGKGV